jgi:hypothetical protein
MERPTTMTWVEALRAGANTENSKLVLLEIFREGWVPAKVFLREFVLG